MVQGANILVLPKKLLELEKKPAKEEDRLSGMRKVNFAMMGKDGIPVVYRGKVKTSQFRWSVDVEDSFAPTLMAIPRMLLHLRSMCPQYCGVQVIDVKNAFLMAPQPEEEKALVTQRYKLVRCLPDSGQQPTDGTSICRDAAQEFGDMQPTLIKFKRPLLALRGGLRQAWRKS